MDRTQQNLDDDELIEAVMSRLGESQRRGITVNLRR